VHYLVGLRGIAAVKDGDAAGRGGWLTGTTITQAKAGAKAGTVVVVRGTKLEEVTVGETSVTVERSLTLPAAGGPLAVDTAAGQIWVTDNTNSVLRRVGSADFTPDGKEIPLAAGAAVSFLEWDTEHGVLWAGRGTVLEAYDIATGELAASFDAKPGDTIADVAVDPRSDRAFAVWQDWGNPPEEGDGVGQLAVYDTATLKDLEHGRRTAGCQRPVGQLVRRGDAGRRFGVRGEPVRRLAHRVPGAGAAVALRLAVTVRPGVAFTLGPGLAQPFGRNARAVAQ
jgi:hypothetical protein